MTDPRIEQAEPAPDDEPVEVANDVVREPPAPEDDASEGTEVPQ